MLGATVADGREAFPELEGQPFFAMHDDVFRGGEPAYGKEMMVPIDRERRISRAQHLDLAWPIRLDPHGRLLRVDESQHRAQHELAHAPSVPGRWRL